MRKRSPAPPPPATASGTATLATVAAATEGAVALASDIHADISARELSALNRAAERIIALFRCVRTRVVLGRAPACCADAKEAHVALAVRPYAEQGDVLAMEKFLDRVPPPDCGMFIYAHALREPSLIGLLPSMFGSLTKAKREQIEAAYRVQLHLPRPGGGAVSAVSDGPFQGTGPGGDVGLGKGRVGGVLGCTGMGLRQSR